MPPLLTSTSVIMCPHGGMVTAVPGQTRATAESPILRGTDTYTIAGCPFSDPDPSPCVSVQWVQTATRVQAGGDFVLNESSVGLCLAATQAPQGTALILQTQPKAEGV
jgi:hypothetical protein